MNDVSIEELSSALLEALSQQSGADEPGTITTPEAAVIIDKGYRTARRLLKQMHAEGALEPAMVIRIDAWGSSQPRKGYRLVVSKQ